MTSDYLKENVLPQFKSVLSTLKKPIPMAKAKHAGRLFLADHVDPKMLSSRGEIYDYFEDIENYAEKHLELNGSVLSPAEKMFTENMHTLAKGIQWAVSHDGFDATKYEPLSQWGYDIQTVAKESM